MKKIGKNILKGKKNWPSFKCKRFILGGWEGGGVQIFIIYHPKNVSDSICFVGNDHGHSIFSFFFKCYNTM